MGNQYAKWDDGPYQNPPRPPARPSVEVWRLIWSEQQRIGYEAGVSAYLMALDDPQWWRLLNDLRGLYIRAWSRPYADGSPGSGDNASWLELPNA